MNTRLTTWAAQTAEAYDRIARAYGDDAPAFYTQSDLTKINDSPRVFIMGINPGSNGSYKKQCEDEYWQLGGKSMDGSHLLKGNPSWSNRFDWPYWQRLYRLFDAQPHPLEKPIAATVGRNIALHAGTYRDNTSSDDSSIEWKFAAKGHQSTL